MADPKRTKLHIDLQTTGSLPDNRLASSFLKTSGGTMTGDLVMGVHNITTQHVPVNPYDVVNKLALDNALTGLEWRNPVQAFNLIGITGPDNLNLLTPAQGEDWVMLTGGTLTAGATLVVSAGDVVEYKASGWVLLEAGVGGFPDGEAADRFILGGVGATLSSPFVQGVDNNKIIKFSGTGFTAIDTGEATNSASLLVQDTFSVGKYDNTSWVFERPGSVASGHWVQFAGAGQLVAGQGLDISGNEIKIDDPTMLQIVSGATAYSWGNWHAQNFAGQSGATFTGNVAGTTFTADHFIAKKDILVNGITGTAIAMSSADSAGVIVIKGSTGVTGIEMTGANGKIVVNSLQVVTGATADGVLVSDAYGNATWQQLAGSSITQNMIDGWNATEAYVGATSSGPTDVIGHIVVRETPAGPTGVGATLTSYDFAHEIIPGTEMVFLGGQLQEPDDTPGDADYAIGITAGAGNKTRITFNGPNIDVNVRVKVGYRYL